MTVADVSALTAAEKRALLQELLARKAQYPLSSGQQWMWFLQQLAPESAAYHFPIALRVTSEVDSERVRDVLEALTRRHPALRTAFIEAAGNVSQLVQAQVTLRFSEIDAAGLSEKQLSALIREESERPFALDTAPLFRTVLFRKHDHDAVLLFVWHHLVMDGWSLTVFLEEFGRLYANPGAELPTVASSGSYDQFVAQQQAAVNSNEGQQQAEYWRNELARAEPLELITDLRPPAHRSNRGQAVVFTLGERQTSRIRALATGLNTTPFVVLLACFQAMLHRVSGRNKVPVSFPTNVRNNSAFERTVGFFVNQLFAVAEFDEQSTFVSLIEQTRLHVLDALRHQDFHLSLLSQDGAPSAHRQQYRPETMFVLQKSQGYALELPRGTLTNSGWLDDSDIRTAGNLGGLTVQSYPLEVRTARFDLEMQMIEGGGAFLGWLQYDSELFEEATARAFVRCFEQMVNAALDDAAQRVSRAPLMDAPFARTVLVEWNDTGRQWPAEGSVIDMFEHAVQRVPDALAVQCGDSRLTYGELDARANQVANVLREAGVQSQQIVGLCIPRSNDMMVALLGILKAGCVYLPLDPSNPQERLAFMLRDSGAQFVVAAAETCTRFRSGTIQQICLHCDAAAIARSRTTPPARTSGPLLNILYTSGSTGQPKGVRGTERGAINRMRWMWEQYPFAPREMCAQITTLGFVDAVWEIFGPLLQGVPSVIVPDEQVRDVPRFVSVLQESQATRITLVPTLLRALLEHEGVGVRLAHLQYWSCAGEALEPALARLFHARLQDSRLFNLYGCSEAAADSTFFEIPHDWNGERVPIGRPISNTQIFVLDQYNQPVAPQIVGEIFVGGDGLADGYLGRPDLTADRFVTREVSGNHTLYRTGDLGRFLMDGTIEYFGRADHQVKVRGNRVELGEIEVVLREHPAVESAAVVARNTGSNDSALIAYVVSRSDFATGEVTGIQALRAWLANRLPTYMLPAHFVSLDTMPLTSSGKVNRRALPPFDATQRSEEFAAPRFRIEIELAQIWADVLGLPRIGIHDNFFDWGGHSMLALQASGRASKQFKRALPVALLFQYPTVAEFCAYLQQQEDSRPRHGVVQIDRVGSRPALFWIPGGAGSNGLVQLRRLAKALGPDQPLHAVATWRAERWSEIESVPARARAYVDVIRKAQPHGPYQIAGFCLGGVVAFEVARLLQEQDETVSFLALINTWLPADSVPGHQWLSLFAQRAVYHLRQSLNGNGVHTRQYLVQRFQTMRRMFRRRHEARLLVKSASLNADRSVREDEVLRATAHLAAQYVPVRFPGRVHVFLSEEPELFGVADRTDPRRAWSRVVDACDVIRVQGDHTALLDEPVVDVFGEQLRVALLASQKPAG